MHKLKSVAAFLAALAVLALNSAPPAAAEVTEVRLARQYGLSYLPLIVMEEQRLIEKHARAAGLGDIKVTWATLGGGAPMNEALLSNSIDFVSAGVAPMITLWAKTNGAVKAVAAFDTSPLYLNSNNPAVKTIRDLGDKDRIALPSPKLSIQAVVLQMAAAREFGQENYARLDRLTVAMKHPDAMIALISGRSEITGHLTSPPFSFQELESRSTRIHKVLDSYDVLGGPHTFNVLYGTAAFHDKNPKVYAAVFAALEDAIAIINRDKKAAAQLYIRVTKTKESLNDLLGQLNNPQMSYTTTPHNVTKFSNFMYKIGTIKSKPRDWKDLFFPNVHGKKGS
jgi:NitT/TauT family transport system substrate-binding protein